MKKLLTCVLVLGLMLSLCVFPATAASNRACSSAALAHSARLSRRLSCCDGAHDFCA